MNELLKVAVKTFANDKSANEDCLQVLRSVDSLENVIITCKKAHNDDYVKFKYSSNKMVFVRLNFTDDLQKHLKTSIRCRECKNLCARNEIPFCDFMQLCKERKFEVVQIEQI